MTVSLEEASLNLYFAHGSYTHASAMCMDLCVHGSVERGGGDCVYMNLCVCVCTSHRTRPGESLRESLLEYIQVPSFLGMSSIH